MQAIVFQVFENSNNKNKDNGIIRLCILKDREKNAQSLKIWNDRSISQTERNKMFYFVMLPFIEEKTFEQIRPGDVVGFDSNKGLDLKEGKAKTKKRRRI